MSFSQNFCICALAIALCDGVAAQAPAYERAIPTGELSISPQRVQVDSRPTMNWSVGYPETARDIVEITDKNQLRANRRVRIQIRVAGVAFQSGSIHLPVGFWTSVGGGNWERLFFGRFDDVKPDTPVFDQIVEAGTTVNFAARGQSRSGQWYDSRSTAREDVAIAALVNDDYVPSYTPAYNQGRIESFLTQYIGSDNRVTLGSRDIIYLFELATRNTNASYFDLQDLVTVVTFTEEPEAERGRREAESTTADEYMNFIRQIQSDTRTEVDLTVASTGSRSAPVGVPIAGSRFQLWTVNRTTGVEYLLDEVYVSAYVARTLISIETRDPYQSEARTRVDQPFTVSIQTADLAQISAPQVEEIIRKSLPECRKDGQRDSDDDDDDQGRDDDDDDHERSGRKSGKSKNNNGHGNNIDGVDSSNPGRGKGGPNGRVDPSGEVDDERQKGGCCEGRDSHDEDNDKKSNKDKGKKDKKDKKDKDKDDDPDNSAGSGKTPCSDRGNGGQGAPDNNLGNDIGNTVAPVDLTKVLLVHNAYQIEEEQNPGHDPGLSAQKVGDLEIDKNGTIKLAFTRSNLDAVDLTAAAGEEVFTVTALAGQSISETILDSKRVQVFPIAQAAISGIDPNEVYIDVPPLTVELVDLYPASKTYVRSYPGSPAAQPAEEHKIRDSVVVIDDAVEHDRTVTLTELNEYFTEDGTHTVEVLHETPFGVDLLAQQTIQVDRNVNFKGSLYSQE